MTADELIDALDGTSAVAVYLGLPTNTVSNWRRRGLPTWTHGKLARMCAERGVDPGPDTFDAGPPRRAGSPDMRAAS